ncbi:MAG: hypothetical protein HQ556_08540 [Candidatus Marinimicrobia bacterium]|nr:hypothetical protein [Candidatus Neomarinimicrobiota bacterium]
MRILAFILLIFLVFACEWAPEPIGVKGINTYQSLKVVTGLSYSIEIEGTEFIWDEYPDTSIVIVELTSSGNLSLFGKGLGISSLTLSYVFDEGIEETVGGAGQFTLLVEVIDGYPISLNIGQSELVLLTDYLDAHSINLADSVDIRYNSSGESIFNNIEYDNVISGINIHSLRPGEESAYITLLNAGDTLAPTLKYVIDNTINKQVLAELFTNTGCVNCPEANHYLDNISAEFVDDFTLVRYHVNWTDPFDPMNLYNPGEVESRRAYYNIFAAPGLVIDGTLVTSLDEDDWSGRVFNASQGLTPVYIGSIDLVESVDSLHLEFELNSFSSSLTDITIWSLVMEDSIEYAGSNGETLHMDVMRDMTSTPISVLSGLSTIQHSLKKPDNYGTVGPMNLLVFVQADLDKSVLQSRKQNLY